MSNPATNDSAPSAKPKTTRNIIAVAIVAVILAGVGVYVLTPPQTVAVMGSVSLPSAQQVIFVTSSSFQYLATVDSAGSYSISLQNQQTYNVYVIYTAPSSGPGPPNQAVASCGTLPLSQSTKLAPYHFDIKC